MGIEAVTLLVLGFGAALLGVSLPGLLNMTAVKIAKENGANHAFQYVLGSLLIIFVQTYVAIFFARLIESSAFITEILHEIGLVIFAGLTIYFLFFAKKNNKQGKLSTAKQNRPFIYGSILALINVFSIPYYVFLSVTLASYNYDIFDPLHTTLFSLGVTIGSALMFYCYILFFEKKQNQNGFILSNLNYIIGCITGIICIITIYKLIR
ncbi:amino acid permease [Myroides sp. LJL110]